MCGGVSSVLSGSLSKASVIFMSLMEAKLVALMVTFSNSRLAAAP